MSGCLVDPPDAEVGLDLRAVQQLAVREHDPVDAERRAAAVALLRLVPAQRLLGHAALPGHLQTPLQRALRVRRALGHVGVVGVHPQLASGRVDDRPGEPVVVGVRVGHGQEPHMLEPQPGLRQRELELADRARAAEPGVHEHDPAPGGQGPGVAVGHAGPREWQPEPPDPRQHTIGARHLALAGRLAHRWTRTFGVSAISVFRLFAM